ncbi:unnamed protein product, partial [Staurois parvus]
MGHLLTPGPPNGDHGAPVSLPKLKKAYEKGTRGISWGPLLTPPGPRAVPEFPNGQSALGVETLCTRAAHRGLAGHISVGHQRS